MDAFDNTGRHFKAEHADVDIVLIDRGIVDSKFYAWEYFKEKKCSAEQFNEFQRTCLNRMTQTCSWEYLYHQKLLSNVEEEKVG